MKYYMVLNINKFSIKLVLIDNGEIIKKSLSLFINR